MTKNEQTTLSVQEEMLRGITNAYRSLCALRGLLGRLDDTFCYTLAAARAEAGAPDDIRGSYWWMQNHYDEVGTAVLAANVLSEFLARQLDDVEKTLQPTVKRAEREKNHALE